MKITLFPTLQEALELHRILLERHGGQGGIRDPGLLQSALARPQSGYYDTLAAQAAALLQSLAMNHAFVDGNKPVAFALTAIFLRMNGFALRVSADDAERFMLDTVIRDRGEIAMLTAWIERHLVAR